jgi:hypothetical protein
VTGLWLFANVALPLIVVAMGYGAYRLTDDQKPRMRPGE